MEFDMGNATCSIDGCDKPRKSRGWCRHHYMRWYKTGTTGPPRKRTAEERFWLRVAKTDTCWNWDRPLGDGYGMFPFGGKGKQVYAHRFAYELLVGRIPDGMTLDHVCRNRRCVNPGHLEPLTNRENVLRGIGPSAVNASKTKCIRGHPLTGENVSLEPGLYGYPRRRCVQCRRDYQRERQREYRRRKRAERDIKCRIHTTSAVTVNHG